MQKPTSEQFTEWGKAKPNDRITYEKPPERIATGTATGTYTETPHRSPRWDIKALR